MTIEEFAKQSGIGYRKFCQLAKKDGFVFKDKRRNWQWSATQDALDAGLMQIGDNNESLVTEQGIEYFTNEYTS